MRLKKIGMVLGNIALFAGALVAVLYFIHQGPFKTRPSGESPAIIMPAGEEATQSASSLDGHDPTGEYGLALGEMGHADTLDLSVTKVSPGPPGTDGSATTAVSFTITNKATADVTIDPQSWSAIDRTQGDVAQVALSGSMQSPQVMVAGQTITGTLFFAGSDIGRVVYSTGDASATQLTWRIR